MMIRMMVRLMLVTSLAMALGCGSGAQPYHGTWKGKDALGQDMQIELTSDNRISLQINGTGGPTGKYSIDLSKTPNHFDIELADRDEINTIVEINGDQLTFENINSSDPRPAKFGDDKVVLERQ